MTTQKLGVTAALGHVIRDLRKERGLRQKDLARLADVHYQTIGAIETGKIQSSYKLSRIAKALRVSMPRLWQMANDRANAMVPDVGLLTQQLMEREGMDEEELATAMGATSEDVARLLDGDAGQLLWGAAAVALNVPLHVFERVAVNGFDPTTDADIMTVSRDESKRGT